MWVIAHRIASASASSASTPCASSASAPCAFSAAAPCIVLAVEVDSARV